jgi:putative SOS response-associated peptidase YedK
VPLTCGKFTQLSSWNEVHAFSKPLKVSAGTTEVVVSTPMRFANIMRFNADGERELVSMRWGFAGRDDAAPMRPKHMHARCETIHTLPTVKRAFAHARGILMVHTFNEGEEMPNGKTKQWVITPQDGQPIATAVICEEWRDGRRAVMSASLPTNGSSPDRLQGRVCARS